MKLVPWRPNPIHLVDVEYESDPFKDIDRCLSTFRMEYNSRGQHLDAVNAIFLVEKDLRVFWPLVLLANLNAWHLRKDTLAWLAIKP